MINKVLWLIAGIVIYRVVKKEQPLLYIWITIRFFLWDIFKVIPTIEIAEKRGLTFEQNVYGDGINRFNCRSFFYNKYGYRYRCAELRLKTK